jgi:hypothetical protein
MSNVHSPEPDPELESFFDEVVQGIELDMHTEGATPDLAAVVALAHRMDASRVPAEAVDEVAAYAPVVPLDQGRRFRQTRDDLELDALCQQVRAHMDQEVARELTQPERPAARPPRHLWIAIAVAAALVIGIGIGTAQATRFLQDSSTTDQNAALHSGREDESDTHSVELREPEPRRTAPRPKVTPPREVEPAPAVEAEEPEPELEPAPLENERTSQRKKRKRNDKGKEALDSPMETVQEKLARLDREAQAAWRARQLAKAEKLFEEIVRLDQSGRYAGLAYGDLFTIAGQRGDKAGQAKHWKAYLKRFPKGRYADDARAGLCRRMAGEAKVACWKDYLEDMPRGSYQGQAQRAIEGHGGR